MSSDKDCEYDYSTVQWRHLINQNLNTRPKKYFMGMKNIIEMSNHT